MAETSQSPSTVIMIRPENFGYNPETAKTNAFQHQTDMTAHELKRKVKQEFDKVVEQLRQAGVDVKAFRDRKQLLCPDAIFPNHWFSVHREGIIFLYPMLAMARRRERRKDVIDYVQTLGTYEVIDLTRFEEDGHCLEGNGSIVFDHFKRVAYACRSPRTNERVLGMVCEKLGYQRIVFNATDTTGKPLYHTNVMMWIGTKTIAICIDSITDQVEKDQVMASLNDSGRQLLFLTQDEISAFAGNCIELTNSKNERILVMSSTTKTALSDLFKWQSLNEAFDKVVICDVSTIELVGGGGIRSMIAGVHLN